MLKILYNINYVFFLFAWFLLLLYTCNLYFCNSFFATKIATDAGMALNKTILIGYFSSAPWKSRFINLHLHSCLIHGIFPTRLTCTVSFILLTVSFILHSFSNNIVHQGYHTYFLPVTSMLLSLCFVIPSKHASCHKQEKVQQKIIQRQSSVYFFKLLCDFSCYGNSFDM